MRKIREILRLKYEQGLSHREIAQACAIGAGTVSRYLRKTTARGVGWPLPAELDDAALEADLFPRPAPVRNRALPDCAYIHRELKRNGVTLQLLWEEYAGVHPSGYRYTQFCEVYRQWAGRLRPSMRQVHRAGEKTFIDFSGKRPSLVDRRTGALRPVELFLAVLGASSLTYAEATETQQLPDWCDAHIHMVEYFGGSTTMWVPDQLRSAVTRPCRYEPDVNRTYEDLAAHYGAVVVPARPRKPYLLRELTIERPDQVWCADITYIPVTAGFLYLVAVMDWASRHVLAWRLSNTMDTGFCIEALEAALRTGTPEIFNTDQGAQFTSAAFTERVLAAGARCSMDGRGRCLDNVFIERLWRSLKYEAVYLHELADGFEAERVIGTWMTFYSDVRPHSALGGRTPAEAYGEERAA